MSKTEAQRLASLIGYCVPSDSTSGEAAALLLRQEALIERQRELLKRAQEALSKGTGWMEHGELIAAIRAHREVMK